ncbi:Uncharacterized protein APZ42_018545 [Daphnia magna]|uniref:Transmembrane protein n=1 Tax=Daphnia magna TaxID=35525 RepID=A0A164Z180_9CRUS|nr:Uncharacterized protein APZ42_018545 [Daphnia magna]
MSKSISLPICFDCDNFGPSHNNTTQEKRTKKESYVFVRVCVSATFVMTHVTLHIFYWCCINIVLNGIVVGGLGSRGGANVKRK